MLYPERSATSTRSSSSRVSLSLTFPIQRGMASPAPAVKVYGPALSTAVSRVLACLLEKDVEFQLINVNMAKGEHKKADYLSIQPFGQVPAFQDEHITLFGKTFLSD
uniref:glutathione transferase n=1 Tax=Kalanchoe fedtschenkoi TaxID=63787 RepID=A0A7N0R804_KALFE